MSFPATQAQIDEILRPSDQTQTATPPNDKPQARESEVARFLAKWLDEFLRIPGTDFKIGLDPLLAIFPGIGSALTSAGSFVILIEAMRSHVSLPVLLRMGGNMLLNALLDSLPAVGPIASAFFKSNLRNLHLLQAWQAGRHEEVRRSTTRLWLALGLLFFLLGLMVIGLIAMNLYLLKILFFSPD
jgi:hypothetical protein